jgi:hypothetical protein
VADRIFRPGEEEAAAKALGEQDTRVLFDGRTVVVECVFRTIVDPTLIASRLREACSGPKLRLNVGTIERRKQDLAIVTKSFVNTDETPEEVAARVALISPVPDRVTAGLAVPREAAAIWAELHRMQDGGD